MGYTDEELMLLEQLTYLNDDVYDAAGIGGKAYEYKTVRNVGELVNSFDEDAIKNLEAKGDREVPSDHVDVKKAEFKGTHVSGTEWAQVIKAIQNNPKLMNLEMSNVTAIDMDYEEGYNIDAITFHENGNDKDAIVCFRGTLNEKEWRDNGEYFAAAATDCNQSALMYINGLSYSNITVVGHSKGANKAAYVYLESDKVSYCVAMDMPGFPPEYYLQNAKVIETKKDGMRCYALESDYVNILVLTIPGVETIYCKGNGVDNFAENHCPNSFLFYNAEGQPVVVVGEPNESMQILHDFTAFAALEMPYETRIQVGKYIGDILGLVLGGRDPEPEDIIDAIFADRDALTTLAAYFNKYCDLYDVDKLDLAKIGLDIKCNNDLEEEEKLLKKIFTYTGVAASFSTQAAIIVLIYLLYKTIKNFSKIKELINLLYEKLKDSNLISDINSKYAQLATLQKRTTLDYTGYGGKKYNYTKSTYNTIKSNIVSFNNIEYELPTTLWNNYSEIEWYDEISSEDIKNAITDFIGMVPELNDNCGTEFTKSFNNMWRVDENYYNMFASHMRFIDTVIHNIALLKERMEFNVNIEL